MRLALFSFIAPLFCSAITYANPLNLYMWEDTLSPNVIDQWQQQSSTPLRLDHFDNDDKRSLLMLRSDQLPFDVVVLDNVSAQIYGRLNMFEDLTDLPNRQHNAAKWNQVCGPHAVPYFWGTVGIAFRHSAVKHPPATWHDFVYPPQEHEGKIGMINDSIESFLPLFYALGLSPIEDNPDTLQKAYPQLIEFSDRVLTFEYILSYIRSQADANALDMALAYSGDQYSLNRFYGEGKWGFVIPEGQLFIWVDCLAIPKSSTNKDAAKAFVNFLMDPNIAAINATDIKAATPNLSALKLLPEWYINDASLFPESSRVEGALIDSELTAANISLRAKIINSILKRHEAQH